MPSSRDHKILRGLSIASFDTLCIFLAYLTALVATAPDDESFRLYFIGQLEYLFVFVAVWCIQATDRRLFVSRRGDALLPQLFSFTTTLFLSLLMSIFILALWTRYPLEREFAVVFAGLMFLFMVMFRTTLRLGVLGLRRRGYNYRRILLIGANPRAARIASLIQSRRHYGFQIVGCLDDDPERHSYLEAYGIPYEGTVSHLEDYFVEHVVDVVYIALPIGSQYETIRDIAYLCEGVGVPVRQIGDLFPLKMAKSTLLKLGEIPMLALSNAESQQGRRLVRRVSDFLVSSLLILILSPLMLSIAILIYLDSRGPILQLQRRKRASNGKEFNLARFRTTVQGTDPPTDYGARQDSDGAAQFTRIGAGLRRYGLDELPALFSIFRGQMGIEDERFGVPDSAEHDKTKENEKAGASREKEGKKNKHRLPASRVATLGIDCLGIFGAYLVANYVSYRGSSSFFDNLMIQLPYLCIFSLFWLMTTIDDRRVGAWMSNQLESQLALVTKAVADALVLSTVVMAVFTPQGVGRNFLVVFGAGTFLIILALRVFAGASAWSLRRRTAQRRKILLIGANDRTVHLVRSVLQYAPRGVSIIGVLEDEAGRAKKLEEFDIPLLGNVEDINDVLQREKIEEVFVTLPIASCYQAISGVAQRCEDQNVPVRLLAELFPLRIARNQLMYISDIPLVSLSPVPEEQVRLGVKRAVDLIVSGILLILLFIPMLIIGLIIKLDSRGPVFFAQERVGQNQRRFDMLKYRSMVVGAEDQLEELTDLNEASGPVFKIRKDPRITRVGAFIRKYSIDEFPQLINVFMAQMSLVGPRPPLASEVEKYTWAQRRRLSVKPGMTGLWQVSGRSDVGFDEWVELDLKYIDTWSIQNDFAILLRTFRAVIEGRGAA